MKLHDDNNSTKTLRLIKYFSLVIIGVLIIFICSLIQHVAASTKGEYFYSTFFIRNYTFPARALFFVAGFLAGYLYNLNPWYTGICLVFIFPLISIVESIIYAGSHNLIPFEFIVYFIYALPSIIAVFIGKSVTKQIAKRKDKKLENKAAS